ncbi:MAG TPA: hypothetical protein VGM20_12255 [Gemmatimonadales bacterium]|jgi:hypothetical protein
MPDPLPRRDLIKLMGAAGAASLFPGATSSIVDAARDAPLIGARRAEILPLTSTSEVYVPPRGRGYNKFSFDFPEPSVAFDGFRFGFIVFTPENAYSLDQSKMTADVTADAMRITCTGFTWAGGQEKIPGKFSAEFRKDGGSITWTATAEMDRPVKTVSAIIRGIPRGAVTFGGGTRFGMATDNESLVGYPFSGGDLNASGGMGTPLAIVRASDTSFVSISSRDPRVGTKRFFFQPGDEGFRVEAISEADGWTPRNRYDVPPWTIMRTATPDAAVDAHFAQLERAHNLMSWEKRSDVPQWMRNLAMVTTLHGQHYTGYIFNSYARQLEILKWIAAQIPADRVLVFLSAWDGRYYWDYPNYRVSDRMGGDAGFRALINGAHQLGFRMMPMFGTNSANRHQPVFRQIANGATAKIDGDVMNLNWVDWDNDRHQEGWLAYMNPGVDSWRNWLTSRIDAMISTYGVDAYFLDIVGGYTNNTTGDMHEGTRRLVMDLRAKHPQVPCVGEMAYDALVEFIPMYQVGLGRMDTYARYFQHLSSPAPGRGSSGVHESGFGRFNPQTLSLSPGAIPTLQVVDDTFDKYRDVMAAICAKAKERAGI